MKILFQDEHFVFIDKPSGFHVHQPEDPRFKVDPNQVCLQVLRNQLNKYLYPLHRLDAATSGILGFSFSKEAAHGFAQMHIEKNLEKKYYALVRGVLPESGSIDIPLKSDSSENILDALTHFKRLGQVQFNYPVGKRLPFARYSWAEVTIETGRFHQIRRHMAQKAHPVVGDTKHGDSYHNRFFRSVLGLPGLYLRAHKLKFVHPLTQNQVTVEAGWNDMWQAFFDRFPSGGIYEVSSEIHHSSR